MCNIGCFIRIGLEMYRMWYSFIALMITWTYDTVSHTYYYLDNMTPLKLEKLKLGVLQLSSWNVILLSEQADVYNFTINLHYKYRT